MIHYDVRALDGNSGNTYDLGPFIGIRDISKSLKQHAVKDVYVHIKIQYEANLEASGTASWVSSESIFGWNESQVT